MPRLAWLVTHLWGTCVVLIGVYWSSPYRGSPYRGRVVPIGVVPIGVYWSSPYRVVRVLE